MQQYLDLMRHVRDHGVTKTDRTGTGTVCVFGHQMRFDLTDETLERELKGYGLYHNVTDSGNVEDLVKTVLENNGNTPFNTRGCGMTVGRRGSNKKSMLGIIDPGFLLLPGQRVRMCTGNPATESNGPMPEIADGEALTNYSLFLPKTYLVPGVVLTLVLRGLSVSKAEFDPAAPGGIAGAK